MCDVRLHTSCYHKTKKTGLKMTRRWICDKCNYLKSLPTSVGIACALCPNTSGVFCMLDPKKYTLPWVHYNCAKTFLGEDGIVFNTSTEYYEAQLDFIPSSNFEQICADCTKPSYAQYGAKIPCHLCDKYYHVTCTEQYHLAFQGEPYECLDHTNTTKKDSGSSRKRRLAVVYHRWVGRRNQHLFEEFGKVPRMLTLDLWKSIDLSKISMGKLTHHYQRSLAIIQNNESYPVENTQYSQWVDYILALFASLYSSYDMERNRSIFTLKGFDVHIGYDFKPTEGNTSPTVPSHTALSILTSKNKSQKPKQHTPAAVIPSDDLICAICLQHDLPAQVWERHHLDDDYKAKLISTTGQRKPGYTGTGSYWDPQVFIRCCRCETIVHCGCPQPPIKAYPQKFRVFICIKCDIKHEQAARNQLKSTARRSHQVNYKE
ncbi:uncharacterized protein B0P05DRAFT_526782 [Gilbertella persicaria]|nr:uncharacterized protein B0P05DRAFT_526782 [Gilbertella persicaria]KAI8091260.1 hypothetical protein B0P05DRAFT_526782 [Gilbertella persicaria]